MSHTQFGQVETSASSCELSQEMMPQPLGVQTDISDTDSTVSAACTRTRTVKTPKHYDM